MAYYEGKGVAQDYAEALKWLRRGANNFDARARYKLGEMYYEGKGVTKDYMQAYMWLNLAAPVSKAAESLRDLLAEGMTSQQIEEGQRLAREWRPGQEK